MTFRNTSALASLLSLTFFSLGCEVPELEGVQSASAPAVQQPAPEPAAEDDGEPQDTAPADTAPADGPPAVTSEPREVTANDPKKGKKSRQAGGYLGAVGHARFYAEHKLIFSQVEHALNLYWGLEGEYPQSHEEFMEKIIKANQIQLPELDEGVEYLYDPEDHKLKIHSPGGEPQGGDSGDP